MDGPHTNIWAASSSRLIFECRCRLSSHGLEVNDTRMTGADQEDRESSEVAIEEDSSSGRDVGGESSSTNRWRGRGGKNQKKKFDISLPAQHLVRLK